LFVGLYYYSVEERGLKFLEEENSEERMHLHGGLGKREGGKDEVLRVTVPCGQTSMRAYTLRTCLVGEFFWF
jgi:hypothetical protein